MDFRSYILIHIGCESAHCHVTTTIVGACGWPSAQPKCRPQTRVVTATHVSSSAVHSSPGNDVVPSPSLRVQRCEFWIVSDGPQRDVFKCVSHDALMFFTRASRIPRSATAQSHTHTLHAPREYLEVRQIVLTLTLTLCTRLANTSKCDRSCSHSHSHSAVSYTHLTLPTIYSV